MPITQGNKNADLVEIGALLSCFVLKVGATKVKLCLLAHNFYPISLYEIACQLAHFPLRSLWSLAITAIFMEFSYHILCFPNLG